MVRIPKAKQTQHKEVPPTLLIILDGFGLGDLEAKGNAITPKTAPHIFSYMKKSPYTELLAHGKHVGLFPKQAGNSEAGHFTIGAGRPVKQDLLRISEAIDDGTFFKNEAFKQAMYHVRANNSAVHVMGLLTDGTSAHAHPDHLFSLLEFFRRQKQKEVYLHLFTDGRVSPPHAALGYLKNLRQYMKNGEKIATIMGRFYGMDRNKIWKRTQQAYNAMVLAEAPAQAASAEEAIMQAYNRGETDEYILPTIICDDAKPTAKIKDNDAMFFFNARSDRARQITKAFVQNSHFQKQNPGAFKPKPLKNTRFVAMTDFGPDLPGIYTAFPSPDIDWCLAKAIGEERKQLFISETEKYAHVTYFINGGYPEPINGERRTLVKSGGHYSYADHPEMMTRQVCTIILDHLKKKEFDFVCVNLPNADMVGHTGNFTAAKKAVKHMDAQVHRLVTYVLKKKGEIIITADHGNAEQMIHPTTGEMMTEHTTNKVPFVLISSRLQHKRLKKRGSLIDVAPTVLKIMNIDPPKQMTGKSLYS